MEISNSTLHDALHELRIMGVNHLEYKRVSSKRLLEAMTINEELGHLGYTLTPEGIRILANTDNNTRYNFLNEFKELADIDAVKAKPMYPDFPTQVMNMDEAQFRLHQMLHYFSTYGIEWLTGEEVSKGWLPNHDTSEKIENDTELLDKKVIDIVCGYIPYCFTVFQKVLSKRERMTLAEQQLVIDCLEVCPLYGLSDDYLNAINVPFKENLTEIFYDVFMASNEKISADDKRIFLRNICQNTGDIWKCLDQVLIRTHFHLRTSQKRLLVKLLESYPVRDFRENLMLSNTKASEVKTKLNYLDYNEYSRSVEHRDAVNNLRDGNLRSFLSRVKRYIADGSSRALIMLSERPGIMLRCITLLLRNGYAVGDVEKYLCINAGSLSVQTLVKTLTSFGEQREGLPDTEIFERKNVYHILESALLKRLESRDIFKGRKVYIDRGHYDFQESTIETNDKSAEGGYIRSGLAYKIPEDVNRLRFFVYWNDSKNRVDVDLHCKAKVLDNTIHVGWDGDYYENGLIYSGDITHNDAAEYIDIDLSDTDASYVAFQIHCFTEQRFCDIDTVFTGMMAVDKIGQEVKLYNPSNCFFTHNLRSASTFMNYGYINIKNRTLVFKGETTRVARNQFNADPKPGNKFNLATYIDMLIRSQNATLVDKAEDANVAIVMEKAIGKNEISLIDNNFFMD